MLDFLPAGSAIYGGSFIQLGIDAGQRGDIQDRIPSGVLPDFRTDEQRPEPAGFHDKIDAFPAGRGDQVIDDPVGRREKQIDHSGQDHRGNKVRYIDGCLRKSFESLLVQLIQHDCEQDRNRKAEQKTEKIQQESVQEHPSAVITGKELFKVFQPDPLASGNAKGGLVVPKSDLYAVHREITEHNKEGQAGQHQRPKLPVPAYHHRRPVLQASASEGRGNGNTHQESSFGVFGKTVLCISYAHYRRPMRKKEEAKILHTLDIQRFPEA